MNFLRRRINPSTFVITRKQLAKYLKTDPSRIWRWEKWKHVLWVHIRPLAKVFFIDFLGRRDAYPTRKNNYCGMGRRARPRYFCKRSIQGRGGYFISYRQLEHLLAACCALIRTCRDLKALKLVWSAIEREATRYTEDAFNRLSEIHAQRQAYLHRHTTG